MRPRTSVAGPHEHTGCLGRRHVRVFRLEEVALPADPLLRANPASLYVDAVVPDWHIGQGYE